MKTNWPTNFTVFTAGAIVGMFFMAGMILKSDHGYDDKALQEYAMVNGEILPANNYKCRLSVLYIVADNGSYVTAFHDYKPIGCVSVSFTQEDYNKAIQAQREALNDGN